MSQTQPVGPKHVTHNHDHNVINTTNDSSDDEETTPQPSISKAIRDWSKTGRGEHVEFETSETVPLVPGRRLGRGAMGDVYETTIQGYSIAWKKITAKRTVILHQRKEIEILKKLSHAHMVQLVGTYTHRLDLGILLYPVAVCDLHTFFEDVEAYWTSGADDEQNRRLATLSYLPARGLSFKASPAYSQIGCLVSAIDYLHSQAIRHKDLKPSNILISRDRIWLSDFGSATDFSLLSQSATDNERGTPRYFAPEVADWQKNGRAADMFSLGCVLLEIIILHIDGSLKRIRDNRPNPNPAFHANLTSLNVWLPYSDNDSYQMHHLVKEVRAMLSKDPPKRPFARDLLHRLNLADARGMRGVGEPSIFGNCCRVRYISAEQLKEQLHIRETKIKQLTKAIAALDDERHNLKEQLETYTHSEAAWQKSHRDGVDTLRRELSKRRNEQRQQELGRLWSASRMNNASASSNTPTPNAAKEPQSSMTTDIPIIRRKPPRKRTIRPMSYDITSEYEGSSDSSEEHVIRKVKIGRGRQPALSSRATRGHHSAERPALRQSKRKPNTELGFFAWLAGSGKK